MTTAFLQCIDADWFLSIDAPDRVLAWNVLTPEGKAQLVAELRGRDHSGAGDDDEESAPLGGGPIDPIPTYPNPNE